MAAFDDNGNELTLTIINTICQIEYIEEAKQIAHSHMTTVESASDDELDAMLPDRLGPIGEDKITHAFCSRRGYNHQVEMEVNTLSSQNLEWCGNKEYTFKDSAEEIKSKFCCITGNPSDILTHLGLEYK